MENQGWVKNTICKDWDKGFCDKGPWCHYAHGKREVGVPVRIFLYRTTMCCFGEKCTNEACGYAHKPSEMREKTDEMSPLTFTNAMKYLESQSKTRQDNEEEYDSETPSEESEIQKDEWNTTVE